MEKINNNPTLLLLDWECEKYRNRELKEFRNVKSREIVYATKSEVTLLK